METASWALLIVVSATLTVFLIVMIIATVYVIKILKQVQRITEQAENAVDSMQAAAATFERSATPLALLKLIANIVSQVTRHNKKKGK